MKIWKKLFDYSYSQKGDICNQNQWSKTNYTSNVRSFNA